MISYYEGGPSTLSFEGTASTIHQTIVTAYALGSFNTRQLICNNLDKFDTSMVENFGYFFEGAVIVSTTPTGSQILQSSVEKLDVSGGEIFDDMFYSASGNPDIGNWSVSNAVSMHGIFRGTTQFDVDLTKWDVSNVVDMSSMFQATSVFNGDISTWKTGRVRTFENMFNSATEFDGDIGAWDTSRAYTMRNMFAGAAKFDADIGAWDVENVDDFSGMFSGAVVFNADIQRWDVSDGLYFQNMFNGALAFNHTIYHWDMTNAVDFENMFNGATAYLNAEDGCVAHTTQQKHNESNPEFCITSALCKTGQDSHICTTKCGACAIPPAPDRGGGGDDEDDTKTAYLWWAIVMTIIVALFLLVGIFNWCRTGNPFTMRAHMGYTSENLLMSNM